MCETEKMILNFFLFPTFPVFKFYNFRTEKYGHFRHNLQIEKLTKRSLQKYERVLKRKCIHYLECTFYY